MINPIAFQIGGLEVRWYGLLIVLGILLAMAVASRNCKKYRVDTDHLLNIVLLIVPVGLIAARLYYVIFNWSYYSANPSEIIAIWHGGLAIHGGIIGGALAMLVYCIVKKMPFRIMGDIITPGVVLAQAIGRWGNFFNQEAYGSETTLPWAIYIDGAYRHPTFLYESLWDLAAFVILMLLWSKWGKRRRGDIMALYFILYSLGRVWIEWLRTDSLMIGDIKMAMLMSVAGVLLGIFFLVYNRLRPVTSYPTVKKTGNKNTKRKK
ncbi:MAG: prolipoprotein diacylglyceryl transferase [Bacillota bacterium]